MPKTEDELQQEITRQLHANGAVSLSLFLEWQEAVRAINGRPSQAGNLDSARRLMCQFELPIIEDCGSA